MGSSQATSRARDAPVAAVAKLRSSRGQKLGEELAIELLVVGFSAPSSETHKPVVNNVLLADARRASARLRNEQILAELRDLTDGLEMVEEQARLEQGMLRPNEILVHINPATKP